MKRLANFFALFAALVACAATVEQYSPVPGAEFSAEGGGALRHVQVFSAVSGGTAKLERIFSVSAYTNAVEISSVAVTNVAVVSSNRLAATSMQVPVVVTNGVTVVTNAALGTISYVTNISVTVTNIPAQTVFTNIYPAADFTIATWTRANPISTFISVATNTTVTATTNSWPVLKETVTAKETIFSGTLTGNQYTNSPAGVYIIPGERLIFSGTSATNGWLRLVLE